MGAELDRLMKLYGVGSATIAPYGGISKPTDTTAADYQTKLDQYNVEKPAYDKYVTDYKNRIASTPMYAQQQYRAALAPDTYENYVKSVSPTPEVYIGPKDGSFFNPDMIVAPPTTTPLPPTGALTTIAQPEYQPTTTATTTTVEPEKKVEEVVTTPVDNFQPGEGSAGGGGWAVGGLIRKYGIGGQVKNYGRGGVSDLADKYDVSEPANPTDLPVVLASNTTAPTMNDAGANPPAAPAAPSMGGYTFGNVGGAGITAAVPAAPTAPAASPSQRFEDLVSKYAGTGDKYKEEIKAASAKAKAETEAFQKRIADAMKGNEDTMPSKAEMYFRLAAALGAPTKTKSGFMENVAGAAGAMADYQKSVTEAKRANQAQNLQLGLKGQELSMQAAKEELAMLRGLDTQEAQDRRAILKAQIEHEMKAMEPNSAEGNRARDEGFIPGTEAFKERVKQLVSQSPTMREEALNIQKQKLEETIKQNEEKNKTLPPKIVELKSEAEKRVEAADAMESKFARAWDLSDPEKDQVFSGSVADKAQRKMLELTNSKHPKVVNTDELEQLLGQNAVDQLKAAFGGNPSNKEGEIIRDLQGIGAKSLEARRVIIENAVNALRERREKEKERLKHINAGDYNKAQQGEK